MQDAPAADVEVIIPNLNRRFSGITSTVAQVVPHQMKELSLAAVGQAIPCPIRHLSWRELIRTLRKPLSDGRARVFHARRNNEMILGLLLRHVLRAQLHLIFTSTAQRDHSGLTRGLYRRMDTLLSTSPRAASFLQREPDAIIPHGIDTAAYTPAADRAAAWAEGGLPGKRGIGIFGRVRPQKGLREFVEALCELLPRHPDFTAVIIGQVTPKHEAFVEELKALTRERGLEERFCWLGTLEFAALPAWFQRMSLVVCASRNEGFGLTCLEAMASGVPVVATRAGAWEMIVREGVDGFLAEAGDTASLSAALGKALDCGDGLEAMGTAARERVLEAFSIEREAAALNTVYRAALEGGATPQHSSAATAPVD